MEERIKIFVALKFVVPSPNPNLISYAWWLWWKIRSL